MFDKIKLWLKKKEWRKRNAHNETSIVNTFNFTQVSVGKGTYGGISAILMADDSCIKIGNYCSIGPKVIFMGGGEHNYKRISTYPFQSKVYKQKTNNPANHSIITEDDVWIGYDAVIMPGVTIGKGSVIGARAIVTKDVPPYSICWVTEFPLRVKLCTFLICLCRRSSMKARNGKKEQPRMLHRKRSLRIPERDFTRMILQVLLAYL